MFHTNISKSKSILARIDELTLCSSEEAVMCLKRRVIEGSIIMLAYNDGEFNNRFYFERQKQYADD